MNKQQSPRKIKLNKSVEESPEQEVQGVMNAIKDSQVKNGMLPSSASIVVDNFSGKKLCRDKSVVFKGKQYFLKKGTEWNDIELFFKKHISFSSKDFEK